MEDFILYNNDLRCEWHFAERKGGNDIGPNEAFQYIRFIQSSINFGQRLFQTRDGETHS